MYDWGGVSTHIQICTMESIRLQLWCVFLVVLLHLIAPPCDAAPYSQDSSSSCEGFSINVGDSSSGSNARSSVQVVNGSDSSARAISAYTSISTSTEDFVSSSASVDIGDGVEEASSSSVELILPPAYPESTVAVVTLEPTQTFGSPATSSEQNIVPPSENGSAADVGTTNEQVSNVEFDFVATAPPAYAENEDNVITDGVDSVQPTPPSTSTSSMQNVIQPSQNGSGADTTSSSNDEHNYMVTLPPASAKNEDSVISDNVEFIPTGSTSTSEQTITQPSDKSSSLETSGSDGTGSGSNVKLEVVTLPPKSAESEDNVITDGIDTMEPTPTSTAISSDTNISHSSDNGFGVDVDGSADKTLSSNTQINAVTLPPASAESQVNGITEVIAIVITPKPTSAAISSDPNIKRPTDNGFDVNGDSADKTSSSYTQINAVTLTPASAAKEDTVIITTVKPTPTSAAPSSEENNIQPSDDNSANPLNTSNRSSNNSSWSGQRLTVAVFVLCGIAAIAAVAVFVSVRKDQERKRIDLGTPADDFKGDDSSLDTPMTHRLDGRYDHGKRGSRYYSNDLVSSRDTAPLASIVVIGPDDEFHTPSICASTHQYQSYSRISRPGTECSVNSSISTIPYEKKAPVNAALEDSQHFDASHGPSMSDFAASRAEPIFDTNNTQVSFSSSTSSEYDRPPTDLVYGSDDGFTDSFLLVSATYSDSVQNSTPFVPSELQEANEVIDNVVSNAIASFPSSLSSPSSLNSSGYDIRDTEASEHMHDSEDEMLYTSSSCGGLSFDGSISPE